MNILVTGATGFLGSRTVEFLCDQPEVTQIIATGRSKAFQPSFSSERVRYVYGDLADELFVSELMEHPVDYLVNCASLSSPWGTYNQFYRANIQSQEHLINASIAKRVERFIYISSPSIYFDFQDHLNLSEESVIPEKQVNHYAQTKLEAEKLLENSGLEYVILRPRALIGRGDTVIMPRLVRSYQEGKLKVLGDGNNVVDLTSVSNMASAIWKSILADREACQTAYNISNGEPVKLWPAINKILVELGYQPVVKSIPYAVLMAVATLMEWRSRFFGNGSEPALTRYSVGVLVKSFTCDISKAKKLLGYEPIQSVDEAMAEFVEWYKTK